MGFRGVKTVILRSILETHMHGSRTIEINFRETPDLKIRRPFFYTIHTHGFLVGMLICRFFTTQNPILLNYPPSEWRWIIQANGILGSKKTVILRSILETHMCGWRTLEINFRATPNLKIRPLFFSTIHTHGF